MMPFLNGSVDYTFTGVLPLALAVFSLLLKSMIVLVLAGAAATLLHRHAATWRHAVWSLGLVGVLANPLFELLLPDLAVGWEVAVPASQSGQLLLEGNALEDPGRPTGLPLAKGDAGDAPLFAGGTQDIPQAETKAKPRTFEQLTLWALLIWAAGMLLVMIRLGFGLVGLRWMRRRSRILNDAQWQRLTDELCGEFGLTRRPRLVTIEQATTPATWGVLRPVIVLPNDVDSWPEAQRRMLLAHELAHVKRCDVLFHVLSRVACAAYWVNPLVWAADHRLRIESEHACDDLVLLLGTQRLSYAQGLLEVARSTGARRRSAFPWIEMAPRSELEARLRAILDPGRARTVVTRTAMRTAGLAMLCITLPLAAFRPLEAARSVEQHFTERTSPSTDGGPTDVCTQDRWASFVEGDPAATRRFVTLLGSENEKDRLKGVRGLGNKGTSEAVPALIAALDDPDDHVRQSAASALGNLGDPRGVAALITALADSSKHVRQAAIGALGALGDAAALGPLAGQLNDPDEHLRQRAAGALGDLGDGRAVEPLIERLRDTNKHVRQSAALALGRLGDPRATNALTARLADAEPHVQAAAAQALGGLGARETTERIAHLFETSENKYLRLAAARSLGQLGDLRGVDYLVATLRNEPEQFSRREAAWALGAIGRVPPSEAVLQAALGDDSIFVRYAAACSLGRIGTNDSKPELQRLEGDENANVQIREAATWALRRIASR